MKTYIDLDENDYTLGPNLLRDSQHEEKEIKGYLKEIIYLLEKMVPVEKIKPKRVKLEFTASSVMRLFNRTFQNERVTQKNIGKATIKLINRIGKLSRTEFKTLEVWELYFESFKLLPFHMGHVPPSHGHVQFKLDLDFVVRESTISKLFDGKYHDRQQ